MKKILFILFFLPIICFSQDRVKFTAAGVTCSMCSNAIHKSLTTDKNIKKVYPNLQTQEWTIEYNKGEFKIENLKKRVEDAGFSLAKVWLNGDLILDNTKKKKNKNGN